MVWALTRNAASVLVDEIGFTSTAHTREREHLWEQASPDSAGGAASHPRYRHATSFQLGDGGLL